MFENDLKRLRAFTKDCRDSMHEPDEQGISAEFGPSHYRFSNGHSVPANVVRTKLDNADTSEMSYDMGFWLVRKDVVAGTLVREWFNLANIVALARGGE